MKIKKKTEKISRKKETAGIHKGITAATGTALLHTAAALLLTAVAATLSTTETCLAAAGTVSTTETCLAAAGTVSTTGTCLAATTGSSAAIGVTSTSASVSSTISGSSSTSGSSSGSSLTSNGKNNLKTEGFSIDFIFGINGSERDGAKLPVLAKITSTEDFEGTIRYIMPGNYGYYSGTDSIAYEKDITLTAGTEKTIEFCLDNSYNSTYCYFQLEDENGSLLIDEMLSMNTSSSEKALVGVLSSDYTAVNYFDRVNINTENYADSASIQELTADTLPSSEEGLEALSYLLINSFDTSVLTAEQQQAILSWVDNGGLLILGGGADYKQTISGFSDVLSVSAGSTLEGTLQVQQQLSETLTFTTADGFYDMQMADGTPLTNVLNNDKLIWAQSYGSGRIVMTAFNLGMEPISSWNFRQYLAARILSAAASGDYSLRLSTINYGYSYDTSSSSTIQEMFEGGNLNHNMVIVILLAFLAFCPIVWLTLKKTDKQIYFWIAVPAGAVLFTVILFLGSWNARIRKPLTASITLINEQENGTIENVSMAILTPKPIWYELNLAEGIKSIETVGNYSYSFLTDLDNESAQDEEYTLAIREEADGYKIRVKNDEAFSTRYLNLTGNNLSGISGLKTEYRKTVNGMSGTITNDTGYDLKAVYVVASASYACIGDIAAGESKTFTEQDLIQTQDIYDLPSLRDYKPDDSQSGNQNAGDQEKGNQGKEDQEKEDQEDITAEISVVYETVYTRYLSQYEYSTIDDCCTFGYIDGYEADYLTDDGIRENNAAVILKEEIVGYSDYNNAHAYSLFDYASSDDGSWDPNDGQMYALEAQTEIKLAGEANRIYVIKKPTTDLYGDTSHTEMYAWNYTTGNWEEILRNTDSIEFADGNCPYLQNGIMKMKFTCQYENEDYVPRLTMIGGND